MFERLRDDHLRYFGRPAPLWECVLARTIGPMPLTWNAREWPSLSPEAAAMNGEHGADVRDLTTPAPAETRASAGRAIHRTMNSGRGTPGNPFHETDLPLEVAITSDRHLIVRGPDIESEMARVKDLVTGWMRGRDEWHRRMETSDVDIRQLVATLDEQPLKKGVYAFHEGPFATTPGVRRIRDPDVGFEGRGGILAVGKMDRSHFAIAEQSNWTLIGCAGGGGEKVEAIMVGDFEDVLRI